MRRSISLAAAVAVVATVIAAAAWGSGAAADEERLTARMKGELEVPGPGDKGASGLATFEVRPQQGWVCFNLRWEDIAAPTAAHIHFGVAGEAGPVVVPLFATSVSPDKGPTLPDTLSGVKGCTNEVVIPEGAPFSSTTQLLRNIKRHPEEYYANVHNLDFPGGAIRGQLDD
jgi:hypothetical protein